MKYPEEKRLRRHHLPRVKTASDAIETIRQFNIDRNQFGALFKDGSSVRGWYAVRTTDGQFIFEPTRIIGYDLKAQRDAIFKGRPYFVTGGVSKSKLKQWFREVNESSVEFTSLKQSLDEFLLRNGERFNALAKIYLPKDQLIAEPIATFAKDSQETYPVGAASRVSVNKFDRDPKASEACIVFYKSTECQICKTDLGDIYGEFAKGFIHVHHLFPDTLRDEEDPIIPSTELLPVCPNCHAMFHHKRPSQTPRSPDELKRLMAEAKRKRHHRSA